MPSRAQDSQKANGVSQERKRESLELDERYNRTHTPTWEGDPDIA